MCENCNTPLTAYGGQVGQEENFKRRLATQVSALDVRPPAVIAMVVFYLLFTLFWPLRGVVSAFAARPHLNSEGTNYIGAAFGTLGPIFACVTLLPIAVLLCGLAYFTWAQRPWTWMAGLVGLGVAVVVTALQNGLGALTILIGIVAVTIAVFWTQARTRAWFGLG
jgi:hypothetical protein